MDKPKLTVEEVINQIKVAMQTKKSEQGNSSQQQEHLHHQVNEINRKLYELNMDLKGMNLKGNIVTEPIITSHRKGIGKVIVFGKRLVRKFLRWYINPPFDQQREFNRSVNKSLRTIKELTDAVNNELQQIKLDTSSRMDQLETVATISADRWRRVERNVNTNQSLDINSPTLETIVEKDKLTNPDMDYVLFEQKFRGQRAEIKNRQRVYLKYFTNKSQVLDIGCGRGEFIELLQENGINVQGIDINEDMVNYCQEQGLPVHKGDLFNYLNAQPDQSFDGIFAAQLIEHLEPSQIIKFINLCHKKLKPEGVLLVETINLQTLFIFANQFYMDLSHQKPVHPLTVEFLMKSTGFADIEFIYSSPVDERRIPRLSVPGVNGNIEEFNNAMQRLNDLLYGPQDYAIIGVRRENQ